MIMYLVLQKISDNFIIIASSENKKDIDKFYKYNKMSNDYNGQIKTFVYTNNENRFSEYYLFSTEHYKRVPDIDSIQIERTLLELEYDRMNSTMSTLSRLQSRLPLSKEESRYIDMVMRILITKRHEMSLTNRECKLHSIMYFYHKSPYLMNSRTLFDFTESELKDIEYNEYE